MRVTPEPALRLFRFCLKLLQHRLLGRILPIPPRHACPYQLLIQTAAVWEHHLRHEAPIAVCIAHQDSHQLIEGLLAGKLPGSRAEGLLALWGIDAMQAHLHGFAVSQDAEGVPITDADYRAGELLPRRRQKHQQEGQHKEGEWSEEDWEPSEQ